ncbi:MAG: glycosyltransferase family 4 protein [Lachnospiraceae bacterium]|nr:glycosyltransferase family 4 protein [Lachnospiraceae bacterium]
MRQKNTTNGNKKRFLNILYVLNSASLYGGNQSILDLIDGLQMQGSTFGVFVLLPERGPLIPYLRQRGVKCYIYPYMQNTRVVNKSIVPQDIYDFMRNIRDVLKILPLINNLKIDIIHSNSSTIDAGALLSILSGKSHIWHFREFMQEDFDRMWSLPFLQKWYMRKSDCIVYISKAVQNKYSEEMVKYRIIYDGIIKVKSNALLLEVKQEHKEIYTLLCCGQILLGKGQLDAVKAVNYLKKETSFKVHLKIVGSGSPSYINQIKKYISYNHLSEEVEIIQFQNDLSDMRKQSDISLTTSRCEGLGRVTVEAMYAGLLTIGTKSGGTLEIIEEGVNGYLYSSGNYIELSKKIEQAIQDIESGKSTQIKSNARESVIKQFEYISQAEKMKKLYYNIIK